MCVDWVVNFLISVLFRLGLFNNLYCSYLSKLLPESKSTYESMLFNRKCWLALDEILAEEKYPTLGLDYLKDSSLEKRVIKRAQQRHEQ